MMIIINRAVVPTLASKAMVELFFSTVLLECNVTRGRVELGRIIRIQFYLGQMDLTRFIKYLGLTWILHWITCADNGVHSANQK